MKKWLNGVGDAYQLLWKYRTILRRITWNEIRSQYAGSVLGLFWLFFYPFLFLGAYASVYLYILNVKFAHFTSQDYVALIFCGLIPFLSFSQALGSGVSSVTSSSSLIKNTLFPIELIPVKAVLASQPIQVVGMFVLLVILAIMGRLTLWIALLPIVWSCQILLTIGLVWILSSLNVYFRDLQNIVSILVLILMMISPIAYTQDMVPEGIRPFLAANPLYYIIICYQDIIMLNKFPGMLFWILFSISLICFWFGYWFFSRMKKVFIDNV